MRFGLSLMFAVMLLTGCTPIINAPPRGEMQYEVVGDTMLIDYSLRLDEYFVGKGAVVVPFHGGRDSVVVPIPEPDNPEVCQERFGLLGHVTAFVYMKGQVACDLDGRQPGNDIVYRSEPCSDFFGWPLCDDWYAYRRPPQVIGVRFAHGFSAFDKAGILQGGDRYRMLAGGFYDIQGLYTIHPITFRLGVSGFGRWHRDFQSTNLRYGADFFPMGRYGLHPFLYAGGTTRYITEAAGPVLQRDDMTGYDVGLGLEYDFEAIDYRYESPFGGTHTIGLLFKHQSSPFGDSWGTRYAFSYSDGVKTFSIQAVAEGTLHRALFHHNNRPLPHKILAHLATWPLEIFSYSFQLMAVVN